MSKIENNIVDQYKLLLAEDGVKLKVTRGALVQIARNAILNNSGARGLQGIFEELLRDTMFESPSDDSIKEFSITRKNVADFMSNKEE
jgi:ATP-dependent Clp protease ATP-binding subunit ClpX